MMTKLQSSSVSGELPDITKLARKRSITDDMLPGIQQVSRTVSYPYHRIIDRSLVSLDNHELIEIDMYPKMYTVQTLVVTHLYHGFNSTFLAYKCLNESS